MLPRRFFLPTHCGLGLCLISQMGNMLVHDAIHPQMRRPDLARTCVVAPQSSVFGSMQKLLQTQELNSSLMRIAELCFWAESAGSHQSLTDAQTRFPSYGALANRSPDFARWTRRHDAEQHIVVEREGCIDQYRLPNTGYPERRSSNQQHKLKRVLDQVPSSHFYSLDSIPHHA
jgi:hypothetical protein